MMHVPPGVHNGTIITKDEHQKTSQAYLLVYPAAIMRRDLNYPGLHDHKSWT